MSQAPSSGINSSFLELGIPKSSFPVHSPSWTLFFLSQSLYVLVHITCSVLIESYLLFNSYCSSNYTARHSKAFCTAPQAVSQWCSYGTHSTPSGKKFQKGPIFTQKSNDYSPVIKGQGMRHYPLNHCLEGVEERCLNFQLTHASSQSPQNGQLCVQQSRDRGNGMGGEAGSTRSPSFLALTSCHSTAIYTGVQWDNCYCHIKASATTSLGWALSISQIIMASCFILGPS